MLATTPSNNELLHRALSHVQFPGESHYETLVRLAPQYITSADQLLMAGVETADVAAIAAKAGLGRGDGQIDLSQFAMSSQAASPPPATANKRHHETELMIELDSVATDDLYSSDDEAAQSFSTVVRETVTDPHDEWGFVTAAACQRPVPGRIDGNLLGDGTGCDGVYRLTSPSSGVSYAVKKIPRPRPGTSTETNLHRELQILHGLRHPGVCHLHAHIDDGRNHLLVLTLCEEGDLFEMVANGSIDSEAAVRAYFIRITQALQYLHENNIYHRDLKLENILVRKSATQDIEINDFGHSRLCSWNSGVQSRGYGTHAYMAPEMFDDADSGNYDPAAVDVWSLGVILYIMIATQYPFGFDSGPGCQTTEQVRRRICNPTPKPNGDFQFTPAEKFASTDLKALLCGMLRVDARQRMTVAQVQASSWANAALPAPQMQPPTLYAERPPLELNTVNPRFESLSSSDSMAAPAEDDKFFTDEESGEEEGFFTRIID